MHQHLGLNFDNPSSAASTSGLQTPPVTQQQQHQHLQHQPQQQHQPLVQAKGPQSRVVGSFPAPPTRFYFLLGSDSPFLFLFLFKSGAPDRITLTIPPSSLR